MRWLAARSCRSSAIVETAWECENVIMLTGDRTSVAKQIAQQLEITDYRAELLPEDKLQAIQQLRRFGVVGMVGDGINDAPALAAADISFAVGGIDIALETADVVLVGSDLRRLAYAVNLSRRTVSVIQQNVIFSLVTKGLFLLLGTFGFVGLSNCCISRYRNFPTSYSQWNETVSSQEIWGIKRSHVIEQGSRGAGEQGSRGDEEDEEDEGEITPHAQVQQVAPQCPIPKSILNSVASRRKYQTILFSLMSRYFHQLQTYASLQTRTI